MQEIIKKVNKMFDLDIREKTRKPMYVAARFLYVRIMIERGYKLKEIAKEMGKDHTTIMHYRDYSPMYPELIDQRYNEFIHDEGLKSDKIEFYLRKAEDEKHIEDRKRHQQEKEPENR